MIVFITKQGDGVDGRLLQISEGDDIAKGLGGIINTVGARLGLNQTVVAQVFVHKQGVQRGCIKAS